MGEPSDGTRELPACPRGGGRHLRAGLAVVQSLAVLPTLDAAAWPRSGGGDGRRQDAGGKVAGGVRAVLPPGLRDHALRGSPRHYQLAERCPLWSLIVDRISGDSSHWIGAVGQRSMEGGRDPCRRLAREGAGDSDHRERVALAD